jgi:hypothetical protein
MSSMPETRYAKSGDTYIAYQVMGEGPFDLVFVPGFISHLDMQLEHPLTASFFARLASFCRLIRFDKRGTGLSDRLSGIPTIEERMDDVRAVMDAAGSTRAALLGFSPTPDGDARSPHFMSLGKNRVIAPRANKTLIGQLRTRGFEVAAVDMSEISKTGGGIHCMRRRCADRPHEGLTNTCWSRILRHGDAT